MGSDSGREHPGHAPAADSLHCLAAAFRRRVDGRGVERLSGADARNPEFKWRRCMATDPDNPLFRFTRDDTAAQNILRVDVQQAGPVAPPSILGNFFENLTFAVVGGISAELLSNPTF